MANPAREEDGEPLDLADIRNSLKSLMWRNMGIRRQQESLDDAAASTDRWCRYVLPRQFGSPEGWELQNMLAVARVMIEAASQRTESRGVHYRQDFPATDDPAWQRHLTFRRAGSDQRDGDV